MSQHTCKACGQPLPTKKTPQCSDESQTFFFHSSLKSNPSYIFITFDHIYYNVSHTEHVNKLIQTRMEPLRNERVLIEYFYLEGAVFTLLFLLESWKKIHLSSIFKLIVCNKCTSKQFLQLNWCYKSLGWIAVFWRSGWKLVPYVFLPYSFSEITSTLLTIPCCSAVVITE